jgi:hypothetical protein
LRDLLRPVEEPGTEYAKRRSDLKGDHGKNDEEADPVGSMHGEEN